MSQNSLIPLEQNRALKAFKDPDGLEPLLVAIEQECRAAPVVLNTKNGRDNIASLAYKIARTKTTLDEIGKGLNAEHQQQIDLVNGSRNKAWARLEALQKEIRKPLTEWEEAEKVRIENHEKALADMTAAAIFADDIEPPTSEYVRERIARIQGIDRDWEEYETRSRRIKGETLAALDVFLQDALRREEEARIAEEKRKEEERLAQEVRDRAIAEAAAKAAREAAEQKAKEDAAALAIQTAIDLLWEQAHRENAEFDNIKAQERAEREEQAKWDAIYDAAVAENAHRDTAARAAQYAKEEADKAAAKAAQDERDRAAAAKAKEAADAAARAQDAANKARINHAAIEAIIRRTGIDNTRAELLVQAIAEGEIPNVTITY